VKPGIAQAKACGQGPQLIFSENAQVILIGAVNVASVFRYDSLVTVGNTGPHRPELQKRTGVMRTLQLLLARSVAAFAMLLLAGLGSVSGGQAQDGDGAPGEELPPAVKAAVAGAKPAVPDEVTVGAFINDIHEINARNHTYSVDLYLWFRWRNPELNPVKTMEFMNRYPSSEHQFESLLDEPKEMPDGSFYGVVRQQGLFSTKFTLSKYPFDRQRLLVVVEDTASSSVEQRYVADAHPISANPNIILPGYTIGQLTMSIADNRYPTNFGDFSLSDNETYSRVVIEVPVTRPAVAVSVKTFVPILLIILSCTLVLFVRPSFVEGRIGLAITALLTLVALQLTAAATLPEVDYLMLVDKAYLASYAFVIAILSRVVATSWVGMLGTSEPVIRRRDRRWAAVLLLGYVLVLGLSASGTYSTDIQAWWRAL
jgi:hypothetical protein